ncbi:MAG: TylF/MycF/NovP-related O-methyltransferase [Anaerolineales bacterium]
MQLWQRINRSPLLQTVFRKIGKQLLLGYPDNARGEKFVHLSRCIGFIAENGIDGDILEFGVSRGGSLLMIEQLARRLLKPRGMDYRIFGFDSFEGLPEPKGIDKHVHGDATSKSTQFYAGEYAATEETVQRMLKENKADLSHVHLIKGWYDQVLTPALREKLEIKRVSLINVDCDFYESTVAVLKWCAPWVRQGTVIIFDDWFTYEARPDLGEQLALHQFLEQNPHLSATPFSSYSWHGKSFIMNCCNRSPPIVSRPQ